MTQGNVINYDRLANLIEEIARDDLNQSRYNTLANAISLHGSIFSTEDLVEIATRLDLVSGKDDKEGFIAELEEKNSELEGQVDTIRQQLSHSRDKLLEKLRVLCSPSSYIQLEPIIKKTYSELEDKLPDPEYE